MMWDIDDPWSLEDQVRVGDVVSSDAVGNLIKCPTNGTPYGIICSIKPNSSECLIRLENGTLVNHIPHKLWGPLVRELRV